MLLPPMFWCDSKELSSPMFLAGKCQNGPQLVAAVGPQHSDSCLLTIKNTCSAKVFLNDTEAHVLVLPVPCKDGAAPTPPSGPSYLQSANISQFHVHRTSYSEFHLAGRRYRAQILHIKVDFPLLGTDFLHHLFVDLSHKCLVNAKRWIHLPCSATHLQNPPSCKSPPLVRIKSLALWINTFS